MIKLIISDMDGTALTENGIFSERTVRAFESAVSKGVKVILATGRSPRSVMKAIKDSNLRSGYSWYPELVFCLNGAINYSIARQETNAAFVLNHQECKKALSAIRNKFPTIFVASEVGREFRCDSGYYEWRKSRIYYDVKHCLTDEELFDGEDGVSKIILHHPTLSSSQLFIALPESLKDGSLGVSITYSSNEVIDVVKSGVSKGAALEMYCKSNGIISSEVVAFGDMQNDIEMLQYACTSFAVSNAQESVKKIVSNHTLSNNEDGVAIAIENILRKK